MELDELENCINSADILCNTIQEKLDYVNRKMGYAGQKLDSNKKVITEMYPERKKDEIKHWKYFEVRRMMRSKKRERAQTVTKDRFQNLLNELSFLKNTRSDLYKLSQNATADKKWSAAKQSWDLQIETGQRIASLEESIYNLTVDPAYHTYQLEQDAEYEEKLNEKLRLFANIT